MCWGIRARQRRFRMEYEAGLKWDVLSRANQIDRFCTFHCWLIKIIQLKQKKNKKQIKIRKETRVTPDMIDI